MCDQGVWGQPHGAVPCPPKANETLRRRGHERPTKSSLSWGCLGFRFLHAFCFVPLHCLHGLAQHREHSMAVGRGAAPVRAETETETVGRRRPYACAHQPFARGPRNVRPMAYVSSVHSLLENCGRSSPGSASFHLDAQLKSPIEGVARIRHEGLFPSEEWCGHESNADSSQEAVEVSHQGAASAKPHLPLHAVCPLVPVSFSWRPRVPRFLVASAYHGVSVPALQTHGQTWP